MQEADLAAQLAANGGVERGQRFVEQEHRRLGGEGARQGHALLLPAGQFIGKTVAHAAEANALEQFAAACGDLRRSVAAQAHGVTDVGRRRHIGKQRIRLENEAHAPFARGQGGDVATAEDHPAGVGRGKPRDNAKQGRLAAAAGPEKADEFVLGGVEGDTVKHGLAAPCFPDVVDTQMHSHTPPAAASSASAACTWR